MRACSSCLRRARMLVELGPGLDRRFRGRRVPGILALEDHELVAAAGDRGQGPPPALAASEDALLSAAAADEREHGVEAVCRHDAAYPPRLQGLFDPPHVLHVLGGVERLQAALDPDAVRATVAIVGSRKAPEESRQVARDLAEALAAVGVAVVSGMAFGIDAAAHEGALAATARGGARTIAVLAGGVERPSPATLRVLHRRIGREGVVVGELPPGTTPRKWGFPARNRIIAGLADATIVVAAARGSGSLITADLAQGAGRVLAAVPGPVRSPRHAGTNDLIRGPEPDAQVVCEPRDVLALLGLDEQLALELGARDPLVGLEGGARTVAEALLAGPTTIERLVAEHDAAAVLAGLGQLEATGRLRRALTGELELVPAGTRRA
ncbi:DNA-processing protein DprA [Patulibacter sp. SYSU D01012]|uniref:DNA-processing protein DprA n=1 Tax=Patulibacter sp. SYSU D01012 TaxID=2817381 RepID=UPI001B30D987